MSKVFLITNQELNNIYASETKKLYDALLVASEDKNVNISEALADLFKDDVNSEITPIDWDSAVNKKELILVSESEMAYIVQTMQKRFANLIEFKHSNNPKLSLAEILDSMTDLNDDNPDVVVFEKPMLEIDTIPEEVSPAIVEAEVGEPTAESEVESENDEVVEAILEPESSVEPEELDDVSEEIVETEPESIDETEVISYDDEEIESPIEVEYSEAKTFDDILAEAGAVPSEILTDEEPETELEIVAPVFAEKPKKKGWFSKKAKASVEVKEEPVEEAPAFVFGAAETENNESIEASDIQETHDEIDYTELVEESYEPALEFESTNELEIEAEADVETEIVHEEVIAEEEVGEPVAEADPNVPAFVFGKSKPVVADVEVEPYESKMALEEISELVEESNLEEVVEPEIESSEIIEEPSETVAPVFAEKPKKKGWFSKKAKASVEVKEEPVEEAPAFVFGSTEPSYESVVSYPSEKAEVLVEEPTTDVTVESFELDVEPSVETLDEEVIAEEEVVEPVAEADPNVPAFVFGKNKPVIVAPAVEVETPEIATINVDDIVVEDDSTEAEIESEEVTAEEEVVEPVAEADPNVPAFVFGKNKPVVTVIEEEMPLETEAEIEISNSEEEVAADAVESLEAVEEEMTTEESTPVFVKPKDTGILADLSEYFDDAEESESLESSTVAVFPKPSLESSVEDVEQADSLDDNDIQVEDAEDSESVDSSEDDLPADEVEAEAIIEEVVETVTTPESPEATAIRIAVATAVAQTLAEVKKQEKAEKKQKKEKKEKAKPVVLQIQPNQDGNMTDTQSIFGTAQPSNIVMNVESLNLSSSGGVVANIDGGNISLGGEEDPIYIHSLSRKRQMYALPERDEEEESDVNEPLRPDEDVNIRAIIKEIKIIDTF